jgi:hypothetical protein
MTYFQGPDPKSNELTGTNRSNYEAIVDLYKRVRSLARKACCALSVKSVSLESPTNTEKALMFYTSVGLTITEIRSVLIGSAGPSVTFSVRYGADVSAAGTEVVTGGITVTNTTTGLSTTTFDSAAVPAGSYVWVTTSATAGTVDQVLIDVDYRQG